MTADDWQPIETAPDDITQDGNPVLVWCDYEICPNGKPFPSVAYLTMDGDWVTTDGSGVAPTHWQPIVPPKQEPNQ